MKGLSSQFREQTATLTNNLKDLLTTCQDNAFVTNHFQSIKERAGICQLQEFYHSCENVCEVYEYKKNTERQTQLNFCKHLHKGKTTQMRTKNQIEEKFLPLTNSLHAVMKCVTGESRM